MKHKIVYVERAPGSYVSIEKAFRQIAANLSPDFEPEFQQVPFGVKFVDTLLNLLFFRKPPGDLYHLTGHIHYLSLLFSPRNTVLSIMDVGFLYRRQGLRRYLLKKLYLDLPVRKLRYITTISSHVREEIIRYTGCDPEKIRVLDLPLLSHFEGASPRKFNSSKPVLLQVGTKKNKNLPNLIRALHGINCELRIIGDMGVEQTQALDSCEVDFVNRQNLSNSEIKAEYESADIIAFCSTYEGFGLPIIEGQAMGKPVITSELSPMKETAGGGACLVNPHDHLSIRAGIKKIICDEDFRNEIIRRGLENVARFEPTVVAQQYESLYTEVLRRV